MMDDTNEEGRSSFYSHGGRRWRVEMVAGGSRGEMKAKVTTMVACGNGGRMRAIAGEGDKDVCEYGVKLKSLLLKMVYIMYDFYGFL